MNLTTQLLGSRKDNVLHNLQQLDLFWYALRLGKLNHTEVVRENKYSLEEIDHERGKKSGSISNHCVDCDLVICGGTLGILLGASLQQLGFKTILIERGLLKGREQEWNISRSELKVFRELELLTEIELEKAIASEYNPGRIGFLGGDDIWVEDVLNIGIDPIYLLETLKQKFLNVGGTLLENTVFESAEIANNGVVVKTNRNQITTRLLIDGMGHFSPIVKQIREGTKPDSICIVVGSCAEGYRENKTGDLIYSFTPIINRCQYFWEAFPARDGRTTYMFSYLDAHPERPSLEYFMEEYLRLLPEYQNIKLEELDFKRFLFGFFPAYRQSPLNIPFDRLLAIGDSNGGQSPVSFGGFGAMVRHLKRLTSSISEALDTDSLSRKDLALIQPYQPNISVTWLFQKTMSVEVEQNVNPNQINNLMNGVFSVMERLGDDVMKPFLQDVIQFVPLAKTLPLVNPRLVLPLLPQIGITPLLSWSWEYFNLALYSGLYPIGKIAQPISNNLSPKQQYYYHRYLDAWKYGSGGDYDS